MDSRNLKLERTLEILRTRKQVLKGEELSPWSNSWAQGRQELPATTSLCSAMGLAVGIPIELGGHRLNSCICGVLVFLFSWKHVVTWKKSTIVTYVATACIFWQHT